MSKILFLNDIGKVTVSKSALALPEFKKLSSADHTAGKRYFEKVINFIYFVYDKDSPYVELSEDKRKELVKEDFFSSISKSEYEAFSEKQEIKDCIAKLNMLQYTPSERHMKACEAKFEQYLELYSETPVNHENYEKIAAQLKGSQSLYDIIDKLKERAFKERRKVDEEEGDYKPGMFE